MLIPCEQVGSVMSKAFGLLAKNQWIDPAHFMDAVAIRSAKIECLGSKHDDDLTHFIADCLLTAGHRPLLSERAERWRQSCGLDSTSYAVRALLPKEGLVSPEHSDSDIAIDEVDSMTLLDMSRRDLESLAAHGATREMIRAHRSAAFEQVQIPKDVMGKRFKDGAMDALPLYVVVGSRT